MERKLKITVNGTAYDVTVEDLTETDGRIIPGPADMRVPERPVAAAAAPTAPTAAAGSGDEVSPLAGVVEALHVSEGQAVKEGDELLTLEAMKMKTHVFAHNSGVVRRIAVKVGDAVDAGQPLLTIE
jgi:biotin carboxyl carrier protein